MTTEEYIGFACRQLGCFVKFMHMLHWHRAFFLLELDQFFVYNYAYVQGLIVYVGGLQVIWSEQTSVLYQYLFL